MQASLSQITSNIAIIFYSALSAINGNLSGCAATGGVIDRPTGVSINNGFLYTSQEQNNTITVCTISAVNGTLSSCTTSGAIFNFAYGFAFNNGLAYVTNFQGNSVSVCSISGGALVSCNVAGGGTYNHPDGIAFH